MNRYPISFAIIALFCVPAVSATVCNITRTLDDGKVLTVINATTNCQATEARVQTLVLAADRSTQEDCPFGGGDGLAHKGLFKGDDVADPDDFGGDRIVVTDHYLAWFDFTVDDGVDWPYGAPFHRSGSLAGLWSLNPSGAQLDFMHYQTGPNGCSFWAPNELIPGSASPNQETLHWDHAAPPTEHCIGIEGRDKNPFCHNFSDFISNGLFTISKDGVEEQGAVVLATEGRLVSLGAPRVVDVFDDDDDSVDNVIYSVVEYRCASETITVDWRFQPQKITEAGIDTIQAKNIFNFFWIANTADNDPTPEPPNFPACEPPDSSCDLNGPSDGWPAVDCENPNSTTDGVFGLPMYIRSSHGLISRFDQSVSPPGCVVMDHNETSPAGTIVRRCLTPACTDPGLQLGVRTPLAGTTPPIGEVGDRAWMEVGQDAFLDESLPLLGIMILGEPLSGGGTPESPEILDWGQLRANNGWVDGILTLGLNRVGLLDLDATQVQSGAADGRWYGSTVLLSPSKSLLIVFEDGFESGDVSSWSQAQP